MTPDPILCDLIAANNLIADPKCCRNWIGVLYLHGKRELDRVTPFMLKHGLNVRLSAKRASAQNIFARAIDMRREELGIPLTTESWRGVIRASGYLGA